MEKTGTKNHCTGLLFVTKRNRAIIRNMCPQIATILKNQYPIKGMMKELSTIKAMEAKVVKALNPIN
jgi:hypothetical protein